MSLKVAGAGPKSQRGIGMIEVLVALLILAIGLLGLASLQTTGLNQTNEARNRSQAVLLAQDMLERMRANRKNLSDYAFAAGSAPDCDTDFAIDDDGAVAANDVDEWRNSVSCLLPAGDASVEVDSNAVTISLSWEDKTSADDGEIVMEAEI